MMSMPGGERNSTNHCQGCRLMVDSKEVQEMRMEHSGRSGKVGSENSLG